MKKDNEMSLLLEVMKKVESSRRMRQNGNPMETQLQREVPTIFFIKIIEKRLDTVSSS
jgi:hypothetical protein